MQFCARVFQGSGKTTAIRDMCQILSDDEKKRVIVVDTSNEIAGDGDVPHRSIGSSRRLQVRSLSAHVPQKIIGRLDIIRFQNHTCSMMS